MDGAGLMIREYDKVSDHSFKKIAVDIRTAQILDSMIVSYHKIYEKGE